MASIAESHRSSPFDGDRMSTPRSRDLPLISNSSSKDTSVEPMDISPRAAAPAKTQERRRSPSPARPANGTDKDVAPSSNATGPVGAAAAAQQPKVVQAAFIHKLYNMLEDQSIQHLISWSSTNESFVMSPSTEFSKVLASYFKHTNISSFVRQLNMYGFHKVSDVFHAASPDSPLWEFKHGAGSFKRGDLAGLREIKRRASRQTLIHRDSFSNPPKPPPPPPQASHPIQAPPPPQPEGPGPVVAESLEQRVQMMDYNLHDVFARLARTDDALRNLTSKCQLLSDGLSRCLQYTSDLSTSVLQAVPDTEHQVHRDVAALRGEIARQVDSLRMMEPSRPAYGASPYEPMASPSRLGPFDTSRRPSLQIAGPPPTFKAPLAAVMASPRRQGSLSGPDSASPSNVRTHQHHPTLPPPIPGPTQPHPLSNVSPSSPPPSNLGRRHTSADIRLQGWQGGPPPPLAALAAGSPYASGQNSGQWPSSPYRAPASEEDRQLRNSLAQYELPKNPQATTQRQITPPAAPDSAAPPYANTSNEAGWQLPGPKFAFRNIDFSAPPSRRGSMASNVHSLLNPADTAEREEEEGPEEKKRKRLT